MPLPLVAFHSAEQAHASLAAKRRLNPADIPSLVFLDNNMPGMGGLDVLQWLRERPAFNDTAVVVLSSCDDPRHLERAAGLGAQCYLINHPPVHELIHIIEDARSFSETRAGRTSSSVGHTIDYPWTNLNSRRRSGPVMSCEQGHPSNNAVSGQVSYAPSQISERNRRHAQIRRLKRVLRFMPRRAVFHRYPLVGRFAGLARRRAYLWSFKPRHVRPAIYLGAILSLWPVVGAQLAIAFAGAVLLRANIMIAGVLQFVTNPFTAAPIYYVTYRVGKWLLASFGNKPLPVPDSASPEEIAAVAAQAEIGSRVTEVIAALFVGGTVCGLTFAVILDLFLLWSLRAGRDRRPI